MFDTMVVGAGSAGSVLAARLSEDSDRSVRRLAPWMSGYCGRLTQGHHSAGTCKMGPSSDPMAVVDQKGQVRGVKNLRVVDASIMPDCVRANINAAVLMLGERVAEFIRQDV